MKIPLLTLGTGLLGVAATSALGYRLGMQGLETVLAAAWGFCIGTFMAEAMGFMHRILMVLNVIKIFRGPPPGG